MKVVDKKLLFISSVERDSGSIADFQKKGRAPVKPNYKAERKITGDPMYGMPLYGKGVSVLDGAMKQFRQAGYDRDV